MPFDPQKFPAQETVQLMARYLVYATRYNDKQVVGCTRSPTRFHAKSIPSIDILGYLNRILKYAPCGTECFLAILIYLERISFNNEILYVNQDEVFEETDTDINSHLNGKLSKVVLDSFNIHRFLITTALVSIKFLSDVFYTNLHISSIIIS
jgi:hypothetical protein